MVTALGDTADVAVFVTSHICHLSYAVVLWLWLFLSSVKFPCFNLVENNHLPWQLKQSVKIVSVAVHENQTEKYCTQELACVIFPRQLSQ